MKNKISVITDLKYFLQFLGGFLGQLHINVLFFMTDRINFVWNKWIYTNCSLNELWLFQNYLSFGSRLINLRYDKNSGKYEGLNWSQTVALILQDTCMNTLVIFTRHFFFKTLINIVNTCMSTLVIFTRHFFFQNTCKHSKALFARICQNVTC